MSSRFEIVMTYTPLHLLWAGGEAVFVFFVLSGYVLAHTDLSTRGAPPASSASGSSVSTCRPPRR